MTRFQPSYILYQNRILHELGGILFAALIIIILLLFSDISKFLISAIIFFSILVSLKFYSIVRRSKNYLKSIVITDTEIEFVIVEKDKEVKHLKFELELTRLKVFELLHNFNRYGRNYKLQIDIKQNEKFETIFEQYEIGKWNLNIFKEIYAAYCKAKNVPYNLSSLKRTNF